MKKLTDHIKSFFAITLLILLASSATTYAQTPERPVDFEAEVIEQGNTQTVILKWKADDNGPRPQHFYIYIANGQKDDPNDFELLQRVPADKNRLEHRFVVPPLQSGEFTFYVTAIVYEGRERYESDPSEMISVSIKNHSDKPWVKIVSRPNPHASVGKEYIYQAKASTNVYCAVFWEIIEGPDGMEINKETGLLTWTPEEEGQYEVEIRAFFECQDGDVEDIQRFTIKVGDNNDWEYVRIDSRPPLYGIYGKEWVYQVHASSNVRCPVLYEWTITHEKGEDIVEGEGTPIRFTPKYLGKYTVKVLARLECEPSVTDKQVFHITIREDPNGNLCAFINGRVTDEDGNPVERGIAMAWQFKDDRNHTPLYRGEINQGQFSINVPDGKYYIQFEAHGYYPEWYEDAKGLKDATAVEIECDKNITLSVVLNKIPEPTLHKVSGSVVDAETNEPAMATIHFMPVKTNEKRDYPYDGHQQFIARTDQDGNYEIELPDVFDYTAKAVPEPRSGYMHQFYDRVENQMLADIIVVEDDVEGIDFFLKKTPNWENGFGGTVRNEEFGIVQARVVAIMIENADSTNNGKKRYSVSTHTDQRGYYSFSNLVPGRYVLLSIPDDRMYIPGYFIMGDLVTQAWREATIIEIGEIMITVQYDITHRERERDGGIIEVRGRVYEEGGITTKSNETPLGLGEPIAGAMIYVLDEQGYIVDFCFTEDDGDFIMEELGVGTFTIYADKVGYSTVPRSITTDMEERSEQEIEMTMTAEDVSDVEDEGYVSAIKIYPSPVNGNATVEFEAVSGSVNMTVFNSIGSMLFSEEFQSIGTGNTFNLDASDLYPGVYFLAVESGGKIMVTQFTVVR